MRGRLPEFVPDRSTPGVVLVLTGALVLTGVLASVLAAAADDANIVLRNAGAVAQHAGAPSAMIGDLAGALTLGSALLGGWVLRESADRARALTIAAGAAIVWTLAELFSFFVSYALATSQPFGSPSFGSDIRVFAGTDLAVWLITAVVLTAATSTIALLGTGRGLARVVALGAASALFAKSMTGHAAGTASHEAATGTMLVHLIAASVWIGGLAVLQALPARSRDDAAVIRRYSHLALLCWIAIAASGVWALAVRMNSLSEILTSAYVQIAMMKAVLLLVLGAFGALQRRELAARTGTDGAAAYRRLAVIELSLMLLVLALAAALSSSPPPAAQEVPATGPTAVLTGYTLPPAPDLGTVLTAWRPDPLSLAIAALALAAWWRPAAPARTRGRSLALVAACVLLVVELSGPIAVYAKALVSVHLLEHMLLLAVVGPLFAIALPIPAALSGRARRRPVLPALLAALPVLLVAAVYVSPLLRATAIGHAGHLGLLLLATAAGMSVTVLVRSADGLRARLVTLAVPTVLLLAAGVVLSIGDRLLAASWFGGTGRTWLADAVADQQRGGVLVLVVTVLAAVTAGALLVRVAPPGDQSSKIDRTVRSRPSSSSRSA